jgi:hypothetical protein
MCNNLVGKNMSTSEFASSSASARAHVLVLVPMLFFLTAFLMAVVLPLVLV